MKKQKDQLIKMPKFDKLPKIPKDKPFNFTVATPKIRKAVSPVKFGKI